MKKGQSLIIQFILFFLIGFSIFLAVGNLFKTRSDVVRGDITDASRKLISSFVSSVAISSNSCKQCDFINSTFVLEKRVTDNFVEIKLNSSGIFVSTLPEDKFTKSTIHNLNETLKFSGTAFSVNPITLTLNKTQNKLEVK